jgi:hypothetical protein
VNRNQTDKPRRRTRLTKAAGAAIITATAALALAGPAGAMTYAGAYSGSSAPTATTGGTSSAPTQDLANLSRNMWAASKGIDAAIHFDKGLVPSGATVALTVSFGSVGTYSGYYSNTYGTRFATKFLPGDGSQRWEVISVTMSEYQNGTRYSYTAGRSVPIKAIWDVTLSTLKFKLLDDCNIGRDSSIELYFSHSAAYGEVYFDLSSGQSHYVSEFAKTWNQVSVSDDLRVPVVRFINQETFGPTIWFSGQELSDQRLLPGTSHHTSFVQNEVSNQCKAQIDYDNYINLHEYIV